ncbi:MAG: CYTH domain-containing protein, partial [Candidatus Binatia bacterium]
MSTIVGVEIEAKFLVSGRRSLDRIAAMTRAGGHRLVALPAERLETVYLDTPRLDLRRERVGLRIRRRGRNVEVTVKSSGRVRGSVHRRPEETLLLARMPRFPYRPPSTSSL